MTHRKAPDDDRRAMEFYYCGSIHGVRIVADGVLCWTDRMRLVRFFEDSLALSTIKHVLVDLSGLAKENDPDEALRLRELIRSKVEAFRGRNIAVVRSTRFPLSSATVHVLMQRGVNIREFETLDEAKAWLTAMAATSPQPEANDRQAVPDQLVRLWP